MHAIPTSLATVVRESIADAALHDSTSPEAIATLHREEVAALYARRPEATVEEASAAPTLPRWNIERALAAIRGEPTPYSKKKPVPLVGGPGAFPSWPVKKAKVSL